MLSPREMKRQDVPHFGCSFEIALTPTLLFFVFCFVFCCCFLSREGGGPVSSLSLGLCKPHWEGRGPDHIAQEGLAASVPGGTLGLCHSRSCIPETGFCDQCVL